MASRTAACSCGNLQMICEGEPKLVLACHCLDCQRRTGSAFGVGAYFRQSQLTPSGNSKTFTRDGQDGRKLHARFCPECGTTVWWELDILPGYRGVAVGAFADPNFPAPTRSVWEQSRHGWLDFTHKPMPHERQPG